MIELKLRSRTSDGTVTIETVRISPSALAVIVCDMWDRHWCVGATSRVDTMAPVMNSSLKRLRDVGALIIHAPSDTMKFYSGSPARARAVEAPMVEAGCDLTSWQRLDASFEGELPIDDSDVGCDDVPVCVIPEVMPWSRQHPAIEIADADAITESGQQVHNLLEQYGTELALIMGVHTNMCVLGRSFGIRSLVRAGRRVALVRDLTDTMYCSRMSPFVSHEMGTQLVIQHIETHWSPSIDSAELF